MLPRAVLKQFVPPFVLALLLTAVATGIGWVLHGSMHVVNLVLIYMAAVITTAVYTSTAPAVLSAFSGFLAFNFFFTAPRGTLLISEREDMLTAALFLLIALLVGPLAARLQVKIRTLEIRDATARIELQLLEKMSGAITPSEIMAALQAALRELVGEQGVVVIAAESGALVWRSDENNVSNSQQRAAIEDSIVLQDAFVSGAILLNSESMLVKALANADTLFAVVLMPSATEVESESLHHSTDILLQQAGLALGRTRLLTDLARERLEKEQELLRSSLLSSVSHDFRTPLTAMIGATTTLMEMGDTLTQEQKNELLESVLSEAERLNNYTQNLLDMTRLGRGELKLERSWVSIEEIINITLKRIRPLAEAHHLLVAVASGLPLLRVHPALIEQAIFNVLHNALKFSPLHSTVQLNCRAENNGDAHTLILEVLDEGPGIDESERDKVFKMFHTAEKGDRRVAGSGLGLAICKGMIGAHGGAVVIENRLGEQGCLVRMTIPVSDQQEHDSVAMTSGEETDDHDSSD